MEVDVPAERGSRSRSWAIRSGRRSSCCRRPSCGATSSCGWRPPPADGAPGEGLGAAAPPARGRAVPASSTLGCAWRSCRGCSTCPKATLRRDLDLLFMSGLPPYGPGDLIEVQVEDGRVWISMADYFARPLRLTRSEALALYLEGKALLGTPGLPEAAALESALGKLEEALGPESPRRAGRPRRGRRAGRGAHRAPGRVPRGGRRAPAARDRVLRGVDCRDHGAGGGPEVVFSALGRWYVVAFDHRSGEERMFRLDRIRRAEPTGDSFEPRGLAGAGRPLYTRAGGGHRGAAPARAGRPVGGRVLRDRSRGRTGDGSVDVTIPTQAPRVGRQVGTAPGRRGRDPVPPTSCGRGSAGSRDGAGRLPRRHALTTRRSAGRGSAVRPPPPGSSRFGPSARTSQACSTHRRYQQRHDHHPNDLPPLWGSGHGPGGDPAVGRAGRQRGLLPIRVPGVHGTGREARGSQDRRPAGLGRAST